MTDIKKIAQAVLDAWELLQRTPSVYSLEKYRNACGKLGSHAPAVIEQDAVIEETIDALKTLVELKAYKDKVGKDVNYAVWQVDAWIKANKVLSDPAVAKYLKEREGKL